MFLIIFLLLIINIFLLISILSTCSDINDNILDLEKYLRWKRNRSFRKNG